MAICEKCGKEYLTRECLRCKQGLPPKRKTSLPMIIIAISVAIIAVLMVAKEYRRQQEEKQIAKMVYGTDDPEQIEQINKNLMKQNEKIMKELRKLYTPN